MGEDFLFLHELTARKVYRKGELIGRFSTRVNNTYSVWIMEKDKENDILVLIHEVNDKVAGILDAKTGKILYLHPLSIDGAMRLWNI